MPYDSTWTLFLDRDGVINRRLPGAYIDCIEDFDFSDGALESIASFTKVFGRIIIVTNQQGIGKGLMTTEQLNTVHQHMLSLIKESGGHIDAIYFCPELRSQEDNNRKPNPQMGFEAQKDFPAIDFKKSVMIGDSVSDMLFGIHLDMKTVFVETNPEEVLKLEQEMEEKIGFDIDFRLPELSHFDCE